ncbi:CTP synthase [Pseudomonas fluorescens]|nr:CTP synthase [Pseudomonas fluorescens]MBD8774241.1 CTP synthase [Pseudomonas fluorescens]MBD8781303.1 CTP synthase [Pseudomonas fluorescens]MBD8796604.1 CTP synthase [Pseudomonas fluorescens]
MAAMERIMELVYSNQLGDFDPNKRYRNPDLFRAVERGVTKVVIVGDYPEIKAAYDAAEIEVEVQTRKTPVTSAAGKARAAKDKVPAGKERTGKNVLTGGTNGTIKDGTEDEPVYIPKLESNDQWIIITRDGVRFGEFVGTADEAKAEADRLNEVKE